MKRDEMIPHDFYIKNIAHVLRYKNDQKLGAYDITEPQARLLGHIDGAEIPCTWYTGYMNCKVVFLKEQKYMGIVTKIFFKEHDEIDFKKLHLDVINSHIKNRDVNDRFMALDSDCQADSFNYGECIH